MAKMATLIDQLTGSALNESLWVAGAAGGAAWSYSSAGASLAFPAASTSSTNGYTASIAFYDLTNSYLLAQVTQVLSAATNTYVTLGVQGSGGTYIAWACTEGALQASYYNGSSTVTVANLTYSASAHAWWRISESAGVTYWDTSDNGTDWVTQASVADPITETSLQAIFSAAANGIAVNPGSFTVLDLNVVPADVTADDVQAFPISPPGFLSPAAFPFPNGPFGLPNDAPIEPFPYVIGYNAAGGANSVTVHVQNATARGDAITVLTAATHTRSSPVSCTDTQGNNYSFAEYQGTAQPEVSVLVAQNTNPLTAADSITVTFKSSDFTPGNVIAIGCSANVIIPSPSSDWLAYTSAGGASTGNVSNQTVTAFSALSFSGPAVIIVTVASGSGFALLPQGWTILQSAYTTSNGGGYYSVAAVKITSSYYAANAAIMSAQSSGGNDSPLDIAFVILQLETRVAAQPGLMPGSQASPPGLMSPGAWPVMPQLPSVVNDAPVSPVPYFIGYASSSATSNSITVPVQNATARGDAITVLPTAPGAYGVPVSCTDTQGNSYSLVTNENVLQPGTSVFVAQNTNQLTATDTVTVTYANSASTTRTAVIVGCPAGTVATSPGNAWLTYTVANFGQANTGTVTVSTPSSLSGSAVIIAVISTTAVYALLQQAWTVLWSGTPSYAIVVAYKFTSSHFVASAVILAAQNAANGSNVSAALVVLQLETRIAPNRPSPDMPPGMMSPGAWQYQPLSPPEGAWSARYNSGPNRWAEALPAASHSVSALTRGTSKHARAISTSHSGITRGIGKHTTAASHVTGAITRRTGKIFAGITHSHGALTRSSQKSLAAIASASGAVKRAASKICRVIVTSHNALLTHTARERALTATAHVTSTVNREVSAHLAAIARSLSDVSRGHLVRLTAGVQVAASSASAHAKVLAAHVASTARLLFPQRVVIFQAISVRVRWLASSARTRWGGSGSSRNQ
jgi:hypothetical protein